MMRYVKFDDGTSGTVDDLTFEAHFAQAPKETECTYPVHDDLRRKLEARSPVTGVSGRTAGQWAIRRKSPATVKPWELRRADYLARKA